MEKKIKMVHESEVIPTIFEDRDSARLITQERDGSEFSLHICTIPGFQRYNYEVIYRDRDELLYLISGQGKMIFSGEDHDFRPGAAFFMPAGGTFKQEAKTELKIIVVMSPPRLRSDWEAKKVPSHQSLMLLEPEDAIRKKE